MIEYLLYWSQLALFVLLLAYANAVYYDGLGYLVLHTLGLAGIGAYSYALLSTTLSMGPGISFILSAVAGGIAGALFSDLLRRLRGDGLTVATFGIGIFLYELFRLPGITRGVYGIGKIPSIVRLNNPWLGMIILISIAVPLTIIIHHWRKSIGGLIVRSLKEDEWGGLSLGARISSHQRLSGCLAGFLSAFAGAYFASIIGFIEPRNYQPTALLLPIAAVIFGAGKIPQRIIAAAIGLTILSQGIRFLGVSSSASGPVAEMMVALILGVTIVYSKIHKKQLNY